MASSSGCLPATADVHIVDSADDFGAFEDFVSAGDVWGGADGVAEGESVGATAVGVTGSDGVHVMSGWGGGGDGGDAFVGSMVAGAWESGVAEMEAQKGGVAALGGVQVLGIGGNVSGDATTDFYGAEGGDVSSVVKPAVVVDRTSPVGVQVQCSLACFSRGCARMLSSGLSCDMWLANEGMPSCCRICI